ncbi:hypothetical protein DFJ73DRAFT_805270 [Zopfochytrium polystomum]|nr:hypothetical protein DFJ73DRAFT_805270 [Zopfochytrium polystomum]
MGVQYAQLAKSMKKLGFENTNTDFVLTSEIASLVAMEYGFNPIVNAMSSEEANFQPRPEPEDWSSYPTRRPVVTIMGHVDHGKTTLLDTLRKSAVAAGEAGGITQHIGAFSVKLPSGKQITFLDTPGHAAFSAMRARGAKVTDIVVLVVAADDGVMPQTVEAIKHAQAAGVDLIVAINKCDKPDAKPAKVKEGLLRYDVVLEEYGGEIPSVEVSGLTGMGLLELEETIITMSELADLRGDPTGPVEATIIESRVARGRGNCATAIVKRGTLKNGQILVSGTTWAKVRALCDENGRPLKEAGPSVPVELSGWKDLPVAGDAVLEAADEDLAKRVVDARMASSARSQLIGSIDALNERRAEWRAAKESEKNAAAAAKKGRAAAARRESEAEKEAGVEDEVEGEVKMLYLVLKADVHGSLEAITDAISGLPSHEVQVKIVDSGVGAVTTSDIEMAEATGAILITFNLPVDKKTLAFAKQHSVPLHPQTVIYKLLDDLKDAMADLLPPVEHHEVVGEAEILQLFDIKVKGSKEPEKAAGCRVLTGKIARASCVKVVRGGGEEVVYDGTLKSFRHHKKDITEAPKGLECGMSFENNPAALAVGDRVVCYNVVKSRRKIQ